MKIRQKMLLFCLLLLVIPNTILAFSGYYTSKTETDALMKKNLENSVKLMIQNIEQLNGLVKSGELPLEDAQEQIKTVMLGMKEANGHRPINKEIDLGENGYFFVLDTKGNALAHPNREGDNLWDSQGADGFFFIQDIVKQGQAGGGFTYYSWPLPDSDKEAIKITYSLFYPEWDWVVAAGSYIQDYNQGQTRIFYTGLVTLIACFSIGSLAIVLFSNHIAGPLRELAKEIKKVATGDLTAGDLKINHKDEIGELAQDFETMRSQLKSLVEQVMYNSGNVSLASHTLKKSLAEITEVSKNIGESIAEIASGMDAQAVSTKESAKAVEELTSGIGRIAETASTAYEAFNRSVGEANHGHQLIGQSIDKMQSIKRAVTEIASVAGQLNTLSQEISTIVNVITDIASQTNLLAINASIEAARAGEHGQGFAVVAQEVQKLAVMSRDSSEQIKALIEKVQSAIQLATQSSSLGLAEVEQGVEVIEQTGMAFDNIVQTIQEAVKQIEEVTAVSEEMSSSAEEILANVQELERIAGNSAANSETISSATEEQIATMDELARSSSTLEEMAAELKEMISRFKI